jgi:hypothetical protein
VTVKGITGIILRVESYTFKPFVIPSLLLILFGWAGLFAIVNLTLPFVWFRWGFFVLLFAAITGTMLPIVYFFHRRFPSGPPAESNVIVRQAMWFGIYSATLAWLQLGRLVTVYVVLALAGGFIALEYVTRLREKSRWKPPISSDE